MVDLVRLGGRGAILTNAPMPRFKRSTYFEQYAAETNAWLADFASLNGDLDQTPTYQTAALRDFNQRLKERQTQLATLPDSEERL